MNRALGPVGAHTSRATSTATVTVVALAALALPIVVALVALHGRHWRPVLDLAMTEARVRDVGTSHSPLIGLPGRIGTLAQQGSHPGPLSFYALAPVYRLLGSSAWALEASTALLDVVALGVSLWIARRRGGPRLVVAVAAVLAFLVWGYGTATLLEPWNPYLPLLWWIVLLLAVWSVLAADLGLLPVAVVAGSVCAQTHLPYLGSTVALLAAAVAVAVVHARRALPGRARRASIRWIGASVAIGVVLWSPVLVDQIRHDPGNLRELADDVRHPPEPPVGLRTAVRLELLHLDVSRIRDDQAIDRGSLVGAVGDPRGSVVPGLLVLAAWAASVVVARRIGDRRLLQLDLAVAVALVLAVVSMARIYGRLFPYLMLWSWGITGLVLLAVAWAVLDLARRNLRTGVRERVLAIGTGAAVVFVVAACATTAVDARSSRPPGAVLSTVLDAIVPVTERALVERTGSATGRDGRYSVTWSDAAYIGAQGYGLVLELERDGFTAGVPGSGRVTMTSHRVLEPADATAVIHLATGMHVDEWASVPGAIRVAYLDPRDDAQRGEFDRTRADAIARLRAAGLDDLVPAVDDNLFAVGVDPRLADRAGDPVRADVDRMLALGLPTAVFVAPPGTVA